MKISGAFLSRRVLAVVAMIGVCEAAGSMAVTLRDDGRGRMGSPPGPQIKTPAQKRMMPEEIRRFLGQQPAAYPRKSIQASGVSAAQADLSSKRVWLSAIDGPSLDVAVAGFYSVSIKNSSPQPWPGVIVTADIDISYAEGIEARSDAITMIIYESGGRQVGSSGFQLFRTGEYHLTSHPFTMNPGREYYAQVVVQISAESGKAKGVIGVISGIKWTI
jgi:hypothetical protein